MDPLSDLDRIYNLVRLEEHHKRYMIDRESKSEITATTLAVNTNQPSRTGEFPICTHCGKARHEESRSYDIIGYPSHWSNWGRGRGGCGSRGGRGGRWSDASLGHGGRTSGREYTIAIVTLADTAAGRDRTPAAAPFLSGLTNYQCNAYLALVRFLKEVKSC